MDAGTHSHITVLTGSFLFALEKAEVSKYIGVRVSMTHAHTEVWGNGGPTVISRMRAPLSMVSHTGRIVRLGTIPQGSLVRLESDVQHRGEWLLDGHELP